MSFQVGDVVMLKSGGPALTVAEVAEAGVTCVWYADSDDNFRSTVLAAACLVAFDDEDDEDEDDEAGEDDSD
ncbi:YodC family protein [Chelatococcus reniformis]|uniref:DUF2158 domain-containing protein n=1 Tax=Chelatococcus reniformis TaxID=1494448 RepID=A0A916XPF5_9HYPH|nr:DUF2158 domain-containing protein [Chelatococcus reniformis]GGC92166.1 hypothetical protein GCM10010994_57480 [Chelatococcus reniformis]